MLNWGKGVEAALAWCIARSYRIVDVGFLLDEHISLPDECSILLMGLYLCYFKKEKSVRALFFFDFYLAKNPQPET